MTPTNPCPDCADPLPKSATDCKCGWTASRREAPTSRPPQVESALAAVLRWYTRKHRLPDCMPQEPGDAVRWWIGMQEQPFENVEKPTQVNVTGKSGAVRWYSPYVERVVGNLVKFIVELNEKDRRYVVAAQQEGIYWRGDPMKFFYKIVEETERLRKMGREAYQAHTQQITKEYANGRKRSAI